MIDKPQFKNDEMVAFSPDGSWDKVYLGKIRDENIDVVSKHRHLFEDKLPKQYSQEDMVEIYELWDKHNKELANQPV